MCKIINFSRNCHHPFPRDFEAWQIKTEDCRVFAVTNQICTYTDWYYFNVSCEICDYELPETETGAEGTTLDVQAAAEENRSTSTSPASGSSGSTDPSDGRPLNHPVSCKITPKVRAKLKKEEKLQEKKTKEKEELDRKHYWLAQYVAERQRRDADERKDPALMEVSRWEYRF